MVAAGNEGHAHLARVMRLRLGNLAGDEGVGTGRNRSLKIALRTTGTPRYWFDGQVLPSYMDHASIQYLFDMPGQRRRLGKPAAFCPGADKPLTRRAKPGVRRRTPLHAE